MSAARLVITLMTPLTALAPQTLPPGPRVTSMRSMSGIDDVLRFPEHAGEDRGVDGAAVDQDEHLVGGADGEAARGDGVLRSRDLRDVEVAGEAQRLRQGHHAHAAQVFAGDHRDRRGHVGEPLDAPRRRRDVGVGELFDRKLLEFVELAGARRLREASPRRERDSEQERMMTSAISGSAWRRRPLELAKKGPKGSVRALAFGLPPELI